MVSDQNPIHLSDLIVKTHIYRCRIELEFWHEVLQRAATLAKKEGCPRGAIVVPDYPRRVSLDEPDPLRETPPEVLEKAQKIHAEQVRIVEKVADGHGKALITFRVEEGQFVCDRSRLEEDPLYEPIAFHLGRAGIEIIEERRLKQGKAYADLTVWEYVVHELIKRIDVSCGERELTAYAHLALGENLPGNSPIVAAIARLHRDGFTNELLKLLWQKYPIEAAAMHLPEITGNGSQERKVQPLDAGSVWDELERAPVALPTPDAMPVAKDAKEAILKLGVKYATVRQLAQVTGRSNSAVQSRISRAMKKTPELVTYHVKRLPEPGPFTAKISYCIQAFWEYIQPDSEHSQTK